mgnify:CR=1 FL=1
MDGSVVQPSKVTSITEVQTVLRLVKWSGPRNLSIVLICSQQRLQFLAGVIANREYTLRVRC